MRKLTLTTVATSVILSVASLIPGAANASALGAATNANPQVADTRVQQVNWWGGGYYRPYHRSWWGGRYSYYHHRPFFFHHRFHRYSYYY